jgi:hypothetical protein
MNGPEDHVKRFTWSSGPFIKGLMLFSSRGWEFPDHPAVNLHLMSASIRLWSVV